MQIIHSFHCIEQFGRPSFVYYVGIQVSRTKNSLYQIKGIRIECGT